MKVGLGVRTKRTTFLLTTNPQLDDSETVTRFCMKMCRLNLMGSVLWLRAQNR